MYHLPKLDQDQISNSNRPITPSEIEAVIKVSQPGPDGFSVDSYHFFQEELTLLLHKLFHEMEGREALPNSFHKPRLP